MHIYRDCSYRMSRTYIISAKEGDSHTQYGCEFWTGYRIWRFKGGHVLPCSWHWKLHTARSVTYLVTVSSAERAKQLINKVAKKLPEFIDDQDKKWLRVLLMACKVK